MEDSAKNSILTKIIDDILQKLRLFLNIQHYSGYLVDNAQMYQKYISPWPDLYVRDLIKEYDPTLHLKINENKFPEVELFVPGQKGMDRILDSPLLDTSHLRVLNNYFTFYGALLVLKDEPPFIFLGYDHKQDKMLPKYSKHAFTEEILDYIALTDGVWSLGNFPAHFGRKLFLDYPFFPEFQVVPRKEISSSFSDNANIVYYILQKDLFKYHEAIALILQNMEKFVFDQDLYNTFLKLIDENI